MAFDFGAGGAEGCRSIDLFWPYTKNLKMKKVIIALVLTVSFAITAIMFWPGETFEYNSIRARAPTGWKVVNHSEGSEIDIWLQPRIGLWSLGLVKIKTSECSNPSSIEELLHLLQMKHPETKFQTQLINKRTWIRTQSAEEGNVTIYQARTLLKNGRCLRILGDPPEVFDRILESLQF
jgi:hypothetical protein